MDKVEEFLEARVNEKSRMAYKCHLNNFFSVIKKNPNKYNTVDIRRLEGGARIDLMDQYEKDIWKFVDAIKERPPFSQQTMLSAVKKFFRFLRIDFPEDLWDEIRKKNGIASARAITEKRTPTRDELRYILDQAPDILHKALFLLMANTGMRIGEAIQLTFDDVDIKNRIIRIRDSTAKKRYYRTTFFTEEAKDYLERWLKKRDDFINIKRAKSKYVREQMEKNKDFQDDRIFPIAKSTALNKWVTLLERAGSPFNDKFKDSRLKYDRYKYNDHCLRRFFKTNLRTAGMQKDFLDYMIAHQNINDERYTDDNIFWRKVKEIYDRYSNALAVFSDAGKIKHDWGQKMTLQDTLINQQRNELEALRLELKQMGEMMNSGWYTKQKDEYKYHTGASPNETQLLSEYRKELQILREIKETGGIEQWGLQQRAKTVKRKNPDWSYHRCMEYAKTHLAIPKV